MRIHSKVTRQTFLFNRWYLASHLILIDLTVTLTMLVQATCMSATRDTVYVIMQGQLHKSLDAGLSWNCLGRLPPLDLAASNIMVFCDQEHGFVGHEASNIYYTCDGGHTWETRLPTRKPFRFVPGLISACCVVPP